MNLAKIFKVAKLVVQIAKPIVKAVKSGVSPEKRGQ